MAAAPICFSSLAMWSMLRWAASMSSTSAGVISSWRRWPMSPPYSCLTRSYASCKIRAGSDIAYLLSVPACCWSSQLGVDDEAAVHQQRRGGHVAGIGREQVCDRGREFLGPGGPVQRDAIVVVLPCGWVLHHRRAHVRHHPARLDRVHPDAVRAQVTAERLGQHADGTLGPAIRGLARGAHVGRDRTHAADRAAVPLPDHLLGAFGADHPGAPDVRLEQII